MGTWAETHAEALERFGQTPLGRDLEAELVEIFEQRPEAVGLAIDDIGKGFAAGRIRSPWGALRAELARQEARAKVVATGNVDRERQLQRLEQYMRAAGLQLADEAEVLDDCFGYGGRWRAFAADEPMRARALELWRSLQPAAAKVEAEALERAENWKRGQQALHAPLVPDAPADIDWPPAPVRLQAYADSPAAMRASEPLSPEACVVSPA